MYFINMIFKFTNISLCVRVCVSVSKNTTTIKEGGGRGSGDHREGSGDSNKPVYHSFIILF